jgi:hypothetical protein
MFPAIDAHSSHVKLITTWKNAAAAQNEAIITGCGNGNNIEEMETNENFDCSQKTKLDATLVRNFSVQFPDQIASNKAWKR